MAHGNALLSLKTARRMRSAQKGDPRDTQGVAERSVSTPRTGRFLTGFLPLDQRAPSPFTGFTSSGTRDAGAEDCGPRSITAATVPSEPSIGYASGRSRSIEDDGFSAAASGTPGRLSGRRRKSLKKRTPENRFPPNRQRLFCVVIFYRRHHPTDS